MTMLGIRTRRSLVYFLQLVLQVTLLQWSMQVAQAVPAAAGAMHECVHAQAAGAPDAKSVVVDPEAKPHGDCCADHMSLDCQYHCAAGGFAFLSQMTAVSTPQTTVDRFAEPGRLPDAVSVGSLYRPPRLFLPV